MGTLPYSINEGSWGYDVINPDSGKVYLHFLSNSRGKNGVFGSSITVGPVDFTVRQVSLVPTNAALSFTQVGNMLTINMTGVVADPVSTIVELSATPPLPGDYNLDRTVDAADYAMWRNALGTPVPVFAAADGNGSGLVDQADYDVWAGHFGKTLLNVGALLSGDSAAESQSIVDAPITTADYATKPLPAVREATLAASSELLSNNSQRRPSRLVQKRPANFFTNLYQSDLLLLAVAKCGSHCDADARAPEEVAVTATSFSNELSVPIEPFYPQAGE
jgi:hypothetical protein